MTFYPVNLKIAGRLCVVVGGGLVALRKIRSLLYCGARIRVISPVAVAEIRTLAQEGDIVWKERRYESGDLEGAFLVFAATNQPDVQQKVALEAREHGVLLNSADDPGACDFQVPAQVRRGDLLLTIATGGASPALAKQIRKQLQREFGPEYGIVVALLARIRDVVVGVGSSEEHRILFRELLRQDIVEYVLQGDWQNVEKILNRMLPPGIDSVRLIQDCLKSSAEERTR